MGEIKEDDLLVLQNNPNVHYIKNNRIYYTESFKRYFIYQYWSGKKPIEIFISAGFDPKVLGICRIRKATERWKSQYRDFSREEIKLLERNPCVEDVNEHRILYADEFKQYFIKKYKAGEKPTEIFRSVGFDPEILGAKRIERAAARWRSQYDL